jgi:acyl-CoA synthetase (AMP-forming)/AMP-acid ligase II
MTLDAGRSLYDNLRAAAVRRPDAPAFTFLDARLRPTAYSHRRLWARCDEVADALTAQGPPRDAPLGLLMQSQEAQVVHYLAALSRDYVPAILTPPNRKLNRDYYLETMRAVVATCRFGAVVADPEVADLPAIVFEPYTLRPLGRGPEGGAGGLGDAACLQFSSGTTGIKRGVLVSHRAAVRQLRTYADALELTPDDCVVSWLPLYHDMGFMACLNMPLALGAHCVMLQPLNWVANAASYLQAVSAYRGTLGWCPNFAYAFMADRAAPAATPGLDLSSLRGLVNCSEPVTHDSQSRFLARFGPCGLRADVFLGCYAMAETAFALTHGRCDRPGALDDKGPVGGGATLPLVSTGRPLPGVEIQVTGPGGEALPERHPGELLVRSPFTFSGYYNNPEATAGAFRDGWYRTGDVGYRVGDEVFVCGRCKDLLIVGGVNVFPQDLEDLVGRADGIRPGRVVAFSEFDRRAQTEKVVVLAESDAAAGEQAGLVVRLRQQCLAALQLANFEVHLLPPGWLIKSSSGKMARRLNQEQWADRRRRAAG